MNCVLVLYLNRSPERCRLSSINSRFLAHTYIRLFVLYDRVIKRSSSRSKGQLQGQVRENIPKLGSCVLLLFFHGILHEKNSIYNRILVIQDHLQGQI